MNTDSWSQRQTCSVRFSAGASRVILTGSPGLKVARLDDLAVGSPLFQEAPARSLSRRAEGPRSWDPAQTEPVRDTPSPAEGSVGSKFTRASLSGLTFSSYPYSIVLGFVSFLIIKKGTKNYL